MRTDWCVEVILYLLLLVAILNNIYVRFYVQAEQLQCRWFVWGSNQHLQLQCYLHFLDMDCTVRSQMVEMQ